jgi:KRAB domain-containing zinc finger protein
MARRYLAIPASSAASERAWSSFGDIYTKKRNRLSPETLCKLLLIKHNQDAVPSFSV